MSIDNPFRLWSWATLAGVLVAPLMLVAGPPFVTDDPVPVEFRHWEVYLASLQMNSGDGWSGTAPHFEVNYGVIQNVQLHMIAPLAYDAPANGGSHYGYGDTELGVKYRFVAETDNIPQIGVFPLLEVPSGDPDRGLGAGHVQVFLPLWIQKSWGEKDSQWTTYGGGGYWFNPGAGNQNWGFIGWLIQRQFPNHLTIGGELFHETAKHTGGDSDTIINVGGIYDFTETYHLMLTAGHTIQGPHEFISYVGFQWTFGPSK
jgi:hypothetical protein